ncbi:MAG: ATPase [Bacteroidetes bacterium]|nr:MAG: ATPase [Bacteroidota bacterium]
MNQLRIALTGVESVGKTTLANALAQHYSGQAVYEFAREYLVDKPTYTASDVLKIALEQIKRQAVVPTCMTFFDTELTVIKLWYETKYQTPLPAHIQQAYIAQAFDLYLLPCPDLAWEADPQREIPDRQARYTLFEKYQNTLEALQRPYIVITGQGQARVSQAIEAIDALINQRS